jgi:hypothetical protein
MRDEGDFGRNSWTIDWEDHEWEDVLNRSEKGDGLEISTGQCGDKISSWDIALSEFECMVSSMLYKWCNAEGSSGCDCNRKTFALNSM